MKPIFTYLLIFLLCLAGNQQATAYDYTASVEAGISVDNNNDTHETADSRHKNSSKGLFSFDGSFGAVIKWIFIIAIALFLLRVLLEIVCTIIGMGIGVWGMTLIVCFILKLLGIIESSTMWAVASGAFKAGCGIGVLFCIFNFGEILNSAASSSSSGSHSSGSNSGSESWESRHGTIYDHPDGSRYIVDENGNHFYIRSGNDQHVYDQNGNHWEIYGISAVKRDY